jgi:hypothetical protein
MLIYDDRLQNIGVASGYIYNYVRDSHFISGMIMHFIKMYILTLCMVCPLVHMHHSGIFPAKHEDMGTKMNCA